MTKIISSVLVLFSISAFADDSCVKTSVVSGTTCKDIKLKVDVSGCEAGAKPAELSAVCWDNKAVFTHKTATKKYTITYGEKTTWGEKSFALLSVKQNDRDQTAKLTEEASANVAVAAAAQEPVVEKRTVQSEDGKLEISGTVDMYAAYNDVNPAHPTPPATGTAPATNKYRAFDAYDDSLNLALAELTLKKTAGPVALRVDLGFGHTADILAGNDESVKNVTQAVVSYTPEKFSNLTVSAGKMMTHMGAEVVRTRDNWNYSRSLLFNYAIPLWHNGFAGTYTWMPGKLSTSLYLYDNFNSVYERNESKMVGAQINYTAMEGLSLVYNFLGGGDGVDQAKGEYAIHEVVANWAASSNLSVQADIVDGSLNDIADGSKDKSWFAYSAAVKYSHDKCYYALRYENFDDKNNARFAEATFPDLQVSSITATWGHDMGGGLESRLEFRQDKASEEVFTGDGKTDDTQSTVTLGLLLNF